MAVLRFQNMLRFFVRYVFPLACVLSVYFLYIYRQPVSSKEKLRDLNFSTPKITRNRSGINNLKDTLLSSNGFLIATKMNRGKTTGSAICVVDPAIIECKTMGFAAFLLYTLDHIILCRALEIDQTTVFWRACNSVCSRDPSVNSWQWYFEPVNHGLLSQVKNVVCLLRAAGAIIITRFNNKTRLNVRPILDNSFKNRSDVDGFESSRIITIQERMRVNKLIQQYVKPKPRVEEKVKVFYQRYLAGFTVLGVHVRGTDHWRETREKRLPSLMSWINRAQLILETLPRPRKIFIASDNDEVVKKFLSHFGEERVIFTEAVRAKTYNSETAPHDSTFEHNATRTSEREIGTQVLMDILLLAKCDHFLHTESSVASLASYFNPHMTSYFLQEDEQLAKKPQENALERYEETEQPETEQEKTDGTEDLTELLECFERNSEGNACPNTAKGIFITSEEAQGLCDFPKMKPRVDE